MSANGVGKGHPDLVGRGLEMVEEPVAGLTRQDFKGVILDGLKPIAKRQDQGAPRAAVVLMMRWSWSRLAGLDRSWTSRLPVPLWE